VSYNACAVWSNVWKNGSVLRFRAVDIFVSAPFFTFDKQYYFKKINYETHLMEITEQINRLFFCNNVTDPVNPELGVTIFKHSVRTAKKTQPIIITKINQLMLFKEIIAVYCEDVTQPTDTFSGPNAELLLIVRDGGTYSYH
jgi:hypothetical protein